MIYKNNVNIKFNNKQVNYINLVKYYDKYLIPSFSIYS